MPFYVSLLAGIAFYGRLWDFSVQTTFSITIQKDKKNKHSFFTHKQNTKNKNKTQKHALHCMKTNKIYGDENPTLKHQHADFFIFPHKVICFIFGAIDISVLNLRYHNLTTLHPTRTTCGRTTVHLDFFLFRLLPFPSSTFFGKPSVFISHRLDALPSLFYLFFLLSSSCVCLVKLKLRLKILKSFFHFANFLTDKSTK